MSDATWASRAGYAEAETPEAVAMCPPTPTWIVWASFVDSHWARRFPRSECAAYVGTKKESAANTMPWLDPPPGNENTFRLAGVGTNPDVIQLPMKHSG